MVTYDCFLLDVWLSPQRGRGCGRSEAPELRREGDGLVRLSGCKARRHRVDLGTVPNDGSGVKTTCFGLQMS